MLYICFALKDLLHNNCFALSIDDMKMGSMDVSFVLFCSIISSNLVGKVAKPSTSQKFAHRTTTNLAVAIVPVPCLF